MLDICKANINNKMIIVYEEGGVSDGIKGIIREATEGAICVETDFGRKIWIKPEKIVKLKEWVA